MVKLGVPKNRRIIRRRLENERKKMEELYKLVVWTTQEDAQLDWQAGRAEIKSLTVEFIGDAEDFGSKIYDLEDEEEFLTAVRKQLAADLEYFKKLWLDFLERSNSYCTLENYGPVRLFETYITENDQNNHDWTILNRIPSRVFEKIGFYR
jgi:hypothetical protein